MKLKSGFVLHEVAGEYLVLPERSVDLSSLLTLNDTGAFLWKALKEETDETALVSALTQDYAVDADTAKTHVRAFLQRLKELKLLD